VPTPVLMMLLQSAGFSPFDRNGAPLLLPLFQALHFQGLAAPVSAYPEDFYVALVNWFLSDAGLTSAFPGGLVSSETAQAQVLPYVRMTPQEPQEPLSGEDWPMEAQFFAYASDYDVCWRLGRYLTRKLDDTADREPIRYGLWTECGHKTMGATTPKKVSQIGDGTYLYRYDVDFQFLITSTAGEPMLGSAPV
jgi:hypothetical protein